MLPISLVEQKERSLGRSPVSEAPRIARWLRQRDLVSTHRRSL